MSKKLNGKLDEGSVVTINLVKYTVTYVNDKLVLVQCES